MQYIPGEWGLRKDTASGFLWAIQKSNRLTKKGEKENIPETKKGRRTFPKVLKNQYARTGGHLHLLMQIGQRKRAMDKGVVTIIFRRELQSKALTSHLVFQHLSKTGQFGVGGGEKKLFVATEEGGDTGGGGKFVRVVVKEQLGKEVAKLG